MSIVEINYYNEATEGFGASLYIAHSDKKVYFEGWQHAELMEAPLTFTLLRFSKTIGSFGGKAAVALYKLVLKDAATTTTTLLSQNAKPMMMTRFRLICCHEMPNLQLQ